MQAITTIGLDIAKSVFQVHGIDGEGNVIAIEASPGPRVLSQAAAMPTCASSHRRSREIRALGHTARPDAIYVRPYVKRQKNDAWPANSP
jgi:transposase